MLRWYIKLFWISWLLGPDHRGQGKGYRGRSTGQVGAQRRLFV